MSGEYLRAYLPSVMPAATGLGDALQEIEQNRIHREQIEQQRRQMEETKATAAALRRSTWENTKYKNEWDVEQQQRGFRQQDVHDVRQIDAEKAKALAAATLGFRKELEAPELATDSRKLLAMRARAATLGIPIDIAKQVPEAQRVEESPPPAPGAIDELLGKPKGLDPMELLTGPRPRRVMPMEQREAASAGAEMRSDAGVQAAERKAAERELAAGPPVTVGGVFVDPIRNSVMARNRQKAAFSEMAPGPGAHPLEGKAFEEGKRAAVGLAPLLGDEKAAAAGEKLRNAIAQRENARINASMSGINFHTGEGRRVASQLQGQVNTVIRETQAQFKTPTLHQAIAASDRGMTLLKANNALADRITVRELIKSLNGAAAAVVEGAEIKDAGSFMTRMENLAEGLKTGKLGATARQQLTDAFREMKGLTLQRLDVAGKAGKARAADKGLPINISPYADSVYQSVISSPVPAQSQGGGVDSDGGESLGGGVINKGEPATQVDLDAAEEEFGN